MDAGGRPGAQAQPPRHHPAQPAQRLLSGLQLREGAARVLQQERAGRGGEGTLAHALEQGGAAPGLQLAHVQAHRGLAQVQALGGAGEAAVPGDLAEGPHVDRVQVHRSKVFLIVCMRTIYFPY